MLVHHLIRNKAADRVAIIDHDGTPFTYGALESLAQTTADVLRFQGVRPGDKVMLICENSAAFAATVLAVSQLDAWIVPVSARHSAQELSVLAEHAEVRCQVVTPQTSAQAAEHAEALRAAPLATLDSGPLCVSATRPCDREPVPEQASERVAALMYTTGTTSEPKGVMLTHANLTWNAKASARLRELAVDDITLGVLPSTHIFGFSSTFLATLHVGACVRFLSRFSPRAVLSALAAGATMMPAVPQMYERLLAHLEESGESLEAPRLRYLSAGGAPLDPLIKRRTETIFGLPLNNGYGLTETSPSVAGTRPNAPRTDLSVGPALEDVRVRIDAPDAGGVGELLIAGPGVMKGYYRDPSGTAEVLRGGWLHSGDLARMDADGALHIVGRAKEIIIRSGFNVHPPEVEAMLTNHPQIRQAAVVGRKVIGNEEILAFVVADEGMDRALLRAWLREQLAPYKVPQHIILVDALPTSPAGKLQRHKLLTQFADQIPTGEGVPEPAAQTPLGSIGARLE